MKRISLLFLTTVSLSAFAQEKKDPTLTEVWQPEPRIVTPGTISSDPPSDAIVLFNGKDLSKWKSKNGGEAGWQLGENAMTVVAKKGDIETKQAFGDCQLHIEWRTPKEVVGSSQGRGNSGIFFMGHYELQVLDNYNNRTYSNGQAGSIYKQYMPLVNACRPPGEWQTYDVIFTAPRFNEKDSTLKSPAYITVLHNGVLVQNHTAIWGSTTYIGIAQYELHRDKEPLVLQDHNNPVSYRNIWIREL
ncbi:MAG: DUF1080 domain-containing protein [Terrimonas sp.]|nr:DUF1080 domain-containing protein [Terrimonas sp.]